jgi:hypothetical protein
VPRVDVAVDEEDVGRSPRRQVPAAVDVVRGLDSGRVDQTERITARRGTTNAVNASIAKNTKEKENVNVIRNKNTINNHNK